MLTVSVCFALLIGTAAIRHGMTGWALRRDDPAAALRWSPKSAVALTAAASANYSARRDEDAVLAARSALARSPQDATALRVLGMAGGRRDLARRREVLRHVFRLTRRDSTASFWLLRDAVAVHDPKAAALQADVLLRRQAADRETVFRILHEVIRTPAGRAALADRLALRPPWREPFLGGAGLTADTTAVALLMGDLRRRGAGATDDEALPLFRRLAVAQRYDELRMARSQLLGRAAGKDELVYDADLDGLPGPFPPSWELLAENYDWKAAAADTGQLRLTWTPPTPGALLRQLIFLKAGRYAVSVTALNAELDANEAFVLEVLCDTRAVIARVSIRTSGGAAEVTRRDFDVPSKACAAQWLQIRASGETSTATAIILDRIDIRPARSDQANPSE